MKHHLIPVPSPAAPGRYWDVLNTTTGERPMTGLTDRAAALRWIAAIGLLTAAVRMRLAPAPEARSR